METIKVGVVVVSDKAASGERPDRCVDAIDGAIKKPAAVVAESVIVPDEMEMIREAAARMIDERGLDVVVTAGGTGVGSRDVTPEALLPLIEKRVTGIEEIVRIRGFDSTPTAILSRAVSGTRGRSLLVALPGSPRGASESLSLVWPALAHAVAILRGEVEECAGQ